MIFNRELKARIYTSELKDSEANFRFLNRALTLEKTKMPLGAKLTQNDFKGYF
jgi:hypothetical protein